MGFAQETGYIPLSIDTIMADIMANINTQFSLSPAYTMETFVGTNAYKYFYALAQRVQRNEVKTSEIFANIQEYFNVINERIQRPVSTAPGLVEMFEREGWIASLKPPEVGDAGKIYICVLVDDTDPDYADLQLEINTLIKDSVAQGIVTMGTETDTIVLSNGQSFDYKFNLPDITEPLLRLTLTLSDNNQVVVQSPEDVKATLIANIAAKYRLGLDFEPQRYFTTADAPWTSQVLLEYSTNDGADWDTVVYEADYDELFDVKLENITLVEE